MEKPAYKKQVALLLSVLPEVAKENCFALHGGTAINLFVRNMPRLSIDIDVTYLPVEDRVTSLANISDALERIKANTQKVIPNARISHREDILKLFVSANGVDIKLEVSAINRGTIEQPLSMVLCDNAQMEFEAFCAIKIVPVGQLYGGKICAALDRQHPRDLFDIKYLLENEGITEAVKTGFIFCLLSSARPIHEILSPNLQDQRSAFNNQFAGMSAQQFNYDEFESTCTKLIKSIHGNLNNQDKFFLLSIKNLMPDWNIYDFSQFPAILWKLKNLQSLKDKNPEKYKELHHSLETLLHAL